MPTELIEFLERHPSFQQLLPAVDRPGVSLSGLHSSAAALVLTLLRKIRPRRFIWITEDNRSAEALCRELKWFHALLQVEGRIAVLPASEGDPYRGLSTHPDIARQRVVALWEALEGRCDVLIAPLRSWMQKLQEPDALRGRCMRLDVGMNRSPQDLMGRLAEMGYAAEDPVSRKGEYAHRGGIVDLYSPQDERPARLEFFGDSLESLRFYDPATQRSVQYISSVTVLPIREEAPTTAEIRLWGEAALQKWGDRSYSRALHERLAFAGEGLVFEGMEFLLPLVRGKESSLQDWMPDATLILQEPEQLVEKRDRIWEDLQDHFRSRELANDLALPPERLFFPEPTPSGRAAWQVMHLQTGPETEPTVHFSAPPVLAFRGLVRDLVDYVSRELAAGHRFVFAMETMGTAERLRDIFQDYGLAPRLDGGNVPAAAPLFIGVGELSHGFELPELGLSFFRQQDVLGEEKKPSHRAPEQDTRGLFISDLRDLREGDSVVHVDHGIGLFQGLRQVGIGDATREFMLLTYRDDARLYVPVERLDLIQKYSGAGGARPALDKLGGTTWEKTKTRVKRAMRDMAEELLRLYAKREAASGHAFSPDDAMQREFEDAFEFRETPDQEAAIRDVKRDMQVEKPMDRLICGDVGYGKTEVAMRAAFKSVLDKKQVAVLTPTTVLAFQHFNTFRERFKAFPVAIEMISRFRSNAEQKDIVRRSEEGKIDILIGTHRVLSKDVKFNDLGLVVVDEEQRFGVAQKEWLKKIKTEVDVLTLSATPIPRTLHMSMLGLRDLSVIETPPQDRMAIQTSVVKFDREIIRSAVEVEMQREGQVFFVHNRVQSVYSMANLVQRICPEARVGVAHGQMPEKGLEEVMLRFMQYQFDVLVCTTIIENGLDIPLANTMIINRADQYGLSQLYQLRGRVGRSDRHAYAYLLVPPGEVLSAVARKRLSAIREFSDLGAGFRVAALDLEIRGAGNLLGGEQHGQINAVGFEMYTQLLRRTVQELRGEEPETDFRTSIDLQCNIRIPEHYIDETNQRLRLYKRISAARAEAELEKLKEEIRDRFGQFPQSVENLFHYGRLRLAAERMKVASIDRKGTEVLVKFSPEASIEPARVVDLVRRKGSGIALTPGGILRLKTEGEDTALLVDRLLECLEQVRG